MSAKKILVLVFLGFAGIVVAGWFYLDAPYRSFHAFHNQNTAYYKEFAQACSLIRLQHPLSTNQPISLDVFDPSLPKIIRDVNPVKMWSGPTGMGLIPGGGIEFGVEWAQENPFDTNIWMLTSTCESQTRVLYRSGN